MVTMAIWEKSTFFLDVLEVEHFERPSEELKNKT